MRLVYARTFSCLLCFMKGHFSASVSVPRFVNLITFCLLCAHKCSVSILAPGCFKSSPLEQGHTTSQCEASCMLQQSCREEESQVILVQFVICRHCVTLLYRVIPQWGVFLPSRFTVLMWLCLKIKWQFRPIKSWKGKITTERHQGEILRN